MEDFKPNFQEVFLTFGLGALFCSVLFFRLAPELSTVGMPSLIKGITVANPLWVPISAGLVFLMHAVGRLTIVAGYLAGYFVKFGDVLRVDLYSELMKVDNVWLWKKFFQAEINVRFVDGIAGICILTTISFLVDIFQTRGNVSTGLWLGLLVFLITAGCCLIQAKLIFLEIRLLISTHKEHLKLVLQKTPPLAP